MYFTNSHLRWSEKSVVDTVINMMLDNPFLNTCINYSFTNEKISMFSDKPSHIYLNTKNILYKILTFCPWVWLH